MNAIGDALREHRIGLGISQEAQAKVLGVSQAQLGHYENGEQSPNMATLRRLAVALEWSPQQIGEVVLGTVLPRRKNARRPLKKVA